MNRHFYAVILLSFLSTNCQLEPDPELTKINGFPDDIDGCSCYFAMNQEDFEQNKFIYLDTYYEGTGFISISNELIKIDLNNPSKNDYKIKIEFDSNKQNGDETWWRTGIMTITTKKGKTLKSKFVGECGC